MLSDFTGVEKVYIPAGTRTCARGAMGWRPWYKANSSLNRLPTRCSCSAEGGKTGSRRYTGEQWFRAAVQTVRERKFDEAVKSLPQKEQAGCAALEGQAFCTKLFSLEKDIQDLPFEEKRKQRQDQAKPVLDALFSWAEEKKVTPPKSALGKALHYLKEQWPYLVRYLEDGRLEISNNRMERSIKPFVMGRKNWLFANTPVGAQASAVIYSLIETAKETGLDPYKFLWVLHEAPKLFEADRPEVGEKTDAGTLYTVLS